jgi:hypothetical protein
MKKFELLDKLEEMWNESQSSFIGSNESELDFRESVVDLIDENYIPVSIVLGRIKELEAEIENEDSEYSEASCRFRIDELKNLIK